MTIPVIGGLATLDPYKNPVMEGMQRGLQTAYMPQQMQAEIAKNQAMAQYNLQHGAYFDPNAAFRQSQENQNNAKAGMYGTASDKNVAQTNYINESTPAKVKLFNSQAGLNDAKADVQPTISAKNVAQAGESAGKAMNLGVGNGTISSNVPSMQQQQQGMQPMGNGGQPAEYPTSQPFTSWKPQQQEEYLDNNPYKAPPLPPGTPRNDKIDKKTEMKIGNIAPSAVILTDIKSGLQDPEMSVYFGKAGKNMIARGEAIAAGKIQGEYPPGYEKYVAFRDNFGRLVSDTLATSQTGSIAVKPMLQFYDALFGHGQLNTKTALSTLDQFGNTLYKEAQTYVAAPYQEKVRDTAYYGLQQLRSAGYGPQSKSSNNAEQGSPQAGTAAPVAQGAPLPGKDPAFDAWLKSQPNGGL